MNQDTLIRHELLDVFPDSAIILWGRPGGTHTEVRWDLDIRHTGPKVYKEWKTTNKHKAARLSKDRRDFSLHVMGTTDDYMTLIEKLYKNRKRIRDFVEKRTKEKAEPSSKVKKISF